MRHISRPATPDQDIALMTQSESYHRGEERVRAGWKDLWAAFFLFADPDVGGPVFHGEHNGIVGSGGTENSRGVGYLPSAFVCVEYGKRRRGGCLVVGFRRRAGANC